MAIKGVAERNIEIAINLRNSGAKLELISQGTGLSIEEIKGILDEDSSK